MQILPADPQKRMALYRKFIFGIMFIVIVYVAILVIKAVNFSDADKRIFVYKASITAVESAELDYKNVLIEYNVSKNNDTEIALKEAKEKLEKTKALKIKAIDGLKELGLDNVIKKVDNDLQK